MLFELESNYLQVAKIPGRDGGYIRVAITSNCIWYQEFCASYTRFRRHRFRTYIKREDTINALKRMIKGDFRGEYASRLREHARTVRTY